MMQEMMWFRDGSGIIWTVCKQSAPRSRQITTPTPWVQIAVATLSCNSVRQTVHTHRASVHQAAKLSAALLRIATIEYGLALLFFCDCARSGGREEVSRDGSWGPTEWRTCRRLGRLRRAHWRRRWRPTSRQHWGSGRHRPTRTRRQGTNFLFYLFIYSLLLRPKAAHNMYGQKKNTRN